METYLGLVPARLSAAAAPRGTTKAGSSRVRWLPIHAAASTLRLHDPRAAALLSGIPIQGEYPSNRDTTDHHEHAPSDDLDQSLGECDPFVSFPVKEKLQTRTPWARLAWAESSGAAPGPGCGGAAQCCRSRARSR